MGKNIRIALGRIKSQCAIHQSLFPSATGTIFQVGCPIFTGPRVAVIQRRIHNDPCCTLWEQDFFFYFKELRLGGFCFYPSVTETILINRGIIPPWICYEAGIRRRKRDWYHKKKWKICFLELIFWIKYKTHSYITTGPNLANIMGNLNEIFTPVWKWNNHIVYNVSVNSNWHACSNHKSVTTRAQGSLFYSLNTCL